MKKNLLTLIILGIAATTNAQWTDSGSNLTTTDNIGIGTTTPSSRLEIYDAPSLDGTSPVSLLISSSVNSSSWIPGADISAIDFYAADNSGAGAGVRASIKMYADNAVGSRYGLKFFTDNTTCRETMRLTDQGELGIGTTNPLAMLHVEGEDVLFYSGTTENSFEMGRNVNENFSMLVQDRHAYLDLNQDDDNNQNHIMYFRNRAGGTSESNDIRFQTGSSDRLTIKTNGHVGIGTTNPNSLLDITGTTANQLQITGLNSTDGATIALRDGSGLTEGRWNVEVDGVDHRFAISSRASGSWEEAISVLGNGNVGIGNTDPGTYKLAVEGRIGARSVKVTTASWADYVFAPSYALMSLTETEAYIQENQHLPNIPSAAEVEANGFNLEEMDAKLLAKIEELTLHMIEQEKRLATQQAQIEALQNELSTKN